MQKLTPEQAQTQLDASTLKKYSELTEADVQMLVLDEKWGATIQNRIVAEINALTLDLVARIQQLGDRYAETVADLDDELEKLEAKVASHLRAMGVAQ